MFYFNIIRLVSRLHRTVQMVTFLSFGLVDSDQECDAMCPGRWIDGQFNSRCAHCLVSQPPVSVGILPEIMTAMTIRTPLTPAVAPARAIRPPALMDLRLPSPRFFRRNFASSFHPQRFVETASISTNTENTTPRSVHSPGFPRGLERTNRLRP